ncbi:methyltransferase-like protein 22 isoform X2 [Mixophyes fleayi]|uniref:methyltransferase-like protein 22 isoform X2 n=1 Tax=Mixophyes fleayi TaxID=3061075 RepID=UPI003F4D7BA7
MEEITFTRDTVLSDIHLHIPHKRHLMVRLNAVGQPVFQTQFKILWENNVLDAASSYQESEQEKNKDSKKTQELGSEDGSLFTKHKKTHMQVIEVLLDDDGDLEVERRPQSHSGKDESQTCSRNVVCPTILTIGSIEQTEEEEPVYSTRDVVKIEHTMATTLEDVGKQIWRGAFVLADYILWQRDIFRGCTVLELGAGTGFTSIIMATVAKTVYCTGGQVKVKELDWLNQFCKDTEASYSWTEDDIADLYDQTTVILAADVFYDEVLTNALFETLSRITHNLSNRCTIYLSVERRFNFTIRHMDITCDAYNHFRNCLNSFENDSNGKLKWTAMEIEPVFPQFFSYEREHLELWKIISAPLT